jgi:hypothetical protein
MSRGNLLQILLVSVFTAATAYAQPVLKRATFTGTYSPISIAGGATASSASGDNGVQSSAGIGFTFNYLGTNYTSIGISTNGIASFSGINGSAVNTDLYTTSAPNAVLAPWWDDLATGTGTILYQTQGASGSRTFTIQWTNVSSYSSGSTAHLNFQLVLHESTNVIEFKYGADPAGTFNAAESASIGIKSATGGNGNFIDAVTGSNHTGNAMLYAAEMWPSLFFRFTPGTASPLSGSYEIGAGGDYPSLSEAVADLNHRGVSGMVYFLLTDSLYAADAAHGNNLFPILIGPVEGTSISSSVSIEPQSTFNRATIMSPGSPAGTCVNEESVSAITNVNEPVIAYVGVDHVGLTRLDLESSTAQVDRGFSVLNSSSTRGTRNAGIMSIHIRLDRSNVNSIGMEQYVAVAPAGYTGSNSWNVYQDLIIRNAYSGISIAGDPVFPDSSVTLNGNPNAAWNMIGDTIAGDIGGGSSNVFGIRAINQDNITITKYIIHNLAAGGAATVAGVSLESVSGVCNIHRLKISRLINTSASQVGSVTGICVAAAPSGTNDIRIYNNFISKLNSAYAGSSNSTRQLRGICVSPAGSSSSVIEIDFNTIVLTADAVAISNTCLEIESTSGPVINLRSNIFANTTGAQSSPAAHYCIASSSSNSLGNSGSVCNYNNFYSMNGGHIGRGYNSDYSDIAAWQTAMTQDMNSLTEDPLFVSADDLHINSPALLSVANPLAWVQNDVDYEMRGAIPDIGADEFSISVDAGPLSIVSPQQDACPDAQQQLVVRIKNYAGSVLDFNADPLYIYATISGSVSQSAIVGITDNSLNGGIPLAVGATIDVVVDTFNLSAMGVYHFDIYTHINDDTTASNDTLRATVYSDTLPVAGFNYTVSGGSVSFTNTSSGSTSYFWDFGDMQTSTQENPGHTYANSGNYTVVLTATDQCGSDTEMVNLPYIWTSVSENNLLSAVHVFPNPASDHITVYIGENANDVVLEIVDLSGALVQSTQAGSVKAGTDIALDLSKLSADSYLLWIRTSNSACSVPLLIGR